MCIVSTYWAEIYLSYMYSMLSLSGYISHIINQIFILKYKKYLAKDFYSEAPFPAASLLVVAKSKHKNNKYDTEYIKLDFTFIEKGTFLFLDPS